jgi:hypothetical protein
MVWFYNQVKTGGPWDYNQYNQYPGEYEDFGNFNYGATGAAVGISNEVLQRGAGAYQVWTDIQRAFKGKSRIGTGSPFGPFPFGDDPLDQVQIMNGISYYQGGCSDPCKK